MATQVLNCFQRGNQDYCAQGIKIKHVLLENLPDPGLTTVQVEYADDDATEAVAGDRQR